MSDSFFGFDAGMPTLGSGQLAGDNELIEAPEEEEAFDLLNDETFGNATDDADWEEQHERLAGDHDPRLKLETLQDGVDPMRSQELFWEFMEHSISQLVVEDEEDSSPGPEAARSIPMHGPASQARAIPTKNNLDDLFGPSSPPGILCAEQLVSPGPNIWGSPVRESTSAPQQGSLQALLQQLQRPPPPVMSAQVPASHPSSGGMPNAKMLEELEREMMGGPQRMAPRSAAVSIPGAMQRPPPRVMTAEQLERELTGQPPPGMPQMPIGTPPPGFPHHHHAPALPRHMMNGAHGDREHARESPSSFPPPHAGTPPFLNAMPKRVSPPGSIKTHTVAPPSVAARMSPMIPQQGRSPYSSAVAAGVISPTVQKPPPSTASNGMDRSSPPNALTSFLANTPVRQRVSLPMPFSDPTHLRSGRGHHHGHHPGLQEAPPHARQALFLNHYRPHPQSMRPNFMERGQRRHFHGNSYYDPAGGGDHMYRDVDEYAGLMTQREKDWIIKIQLMQLHTDNPYVDDFYYTTWNLGRMMERKKKMEAAQGDGRKEKGEPRLLIPSLAKAENKNYRPVQFEGSLGRLTASSVHNPRQILDVKSADMKTCEESQKVREIRRFKQLLLRIEQGYDVLLDIDEMEKMALAFPENERQKVFELRTEKISGLVECLQVAEGLDAGFLQVMSVRKGKKLLARVLPLTTPVENSCIIQAFIRNLPSWNKKEQQEEICETCLEPICESLQTSDTAHLVQHCQLLLAQPPDSTSLLHAAVSSKLGMSVVLCMLNRVEQLHRQSEQPFSSTQQQNSWCTFVAELVQQLQDANCDGLSQIQGAFPLVSKHLCRMVDQPQLVSAQGVFKTLICTEQ